ncbi:hypothetical protein [Burkholderia gladioli]|uniref:hypothetical protein n=1 Tax=Burkholderia gladioli TaxID=28095 RepID=UPI001ABA2882|nr:hypothetical protein [Burkholderia gladioli]
MTMQISRQRPAHTAALPSIPAHAVVDALHTIGGPGVVVSGERQFAILRGLLAHAEGSIQAVAAATAHGLELTAAERDVLAERRRQRTEEGWTAESDDRLPSGQLSGAASAYAAFASDTLDPASLGSMDYSTRPPKPWPWERKWWKPSTVRRALVKAAALILAEIEKIDCDPGDESHHHHSRGGDHA